MEAMRERESNRQMTVLIQALAGNQVTERINKAIPQVQAMREREDITEYFQLFEHTVHYSGCKSTTIKAKVCVAKECVGLLPSYNFHQINNLGSVCKPIKWTVESHRIQFKCNKVKKMRLYWPEPTECGAEEMLVPSVP